MEDKSLLASKFNNLVDKLKKESEKVFSIIAPDLYEYYQFEKAKAEDEKNEFQEFIKTRVSGLFCQAETLDKEGLLKAFIDSHNRAIEYGVRYEDKINFDMLMEHIENAPDDEILLYKMRRASYRMPKYEKLEI